MNDWLDAEQRVARAQEFYESGQWEDAAQELRADINVNPYQGEWHFNLGLTLEALGRNEEAIECYRNALEHHGEDPEILNHIGISLLRTEQPQEAIAAYRHSMRVDPDDPEPLVHCIEAYRQLGDHDAAEIMFYQACQMDDADPRLYKSIAQSLLDRGQVDKAIACLQRARSLDAHDPDIYSCLGEAYWIKMDLDRARRAFLKQVRRNPDDVGALLDLGRVLVEMKRHSEAATRFRAALELDPGCTDAHYELGCVALAAHHLDAARIALENAHRLDPSRPIIPQKLARLAMMQSKVVDARQHLKVVLSLRDPQRIDAGQDDRELAALLIEARMPKWAVGILESLVAAVADDADLQHQLATAKFCIDDLSSGISHARQAIRLNPQHISAMQNLVVVHLKLGQYQRAIIWLRRSLAVDNSNRRSLHLQLHLRLALMRSRLLGFFGY